VTTFEKF